MLIGRFTGLRAIEEKDLDQLLLWRNNSYLRKFFREFRELSTTTQKNWYSEKIIRGNDNIMFSIINLENNSLIGACGLCYVNWKNRNADFSLYIGCENFYIDCKFAFDAGETLLKYAFEELNLHRIYAEVFDFDEQKRELLQKLHFTYEGTSRDNEWSGGAWHNSEFYSILTYEYSGNKR